jgi:hypothetical protein
MTDDDRDPVQPQTVTEPVWMQPRPAQRLTGNEPFTGLDATVVDFWRWAFSDLRENTTRGIPAEYLVATAVGDERELRSGWDDVDVRASDGTTIEVNCSAFLQSWPQRTMSKLNFARLRTRSWDAITNERRVDARVRAEVFVFAVQCQREPDQYDMLDLAHWEFWVIAGSVIRAHPAKSVGIERVRRHAIGPVSNRHLASAIREAADR